MSDDPRTLSTMSLLSSIDYTLNVYIYDIALPGKVAMSLVHCIAGDSLMRVWLIAYRINVVWQSRNTSLYETTIDPDLLP